MQISRSPQSPGTISHRVLARGAFAFSNFRGKSIDLQNYLLHNISQCMHKTRIARKLVLFIWYTVPRRAWISFDSVTVSLPSREILHDRLIVSEPTGSAWTRGNPRFCVHALRNPGDCPPSLYPEPRIQIWSRARIFSRQNVQDFSSYVCWLVM